jgi:hypothetical protein
MLYKAHFHPSNFNNVSVDVHSLTICLLTQSLSPATSHVGLCIIFTSHSRIYVKLTSASGFIITGHRRTESHGQMYVINRLLSKIIIFKILNKKTKGECVSILPTGLGLLKGKRNHSDFKTMKILDKEKNRHTWSQEHINTLAPQLNSQYGVQQTGM